MNVLQQLLGIGKKIQPTKSQPMQNNLSVAPPSQQQPLSVQQFFGRTQGGGDRAYNPQALDTDNPMGMDQFNGVAPYDTDQGALNPQGFSYGLNSIGNMANSNKVQRGARANLLQGLTSRQNQRIGVPGNSLNLPANFNQYGIPGLEFSDPRQMQMPNYPQYNQYQQR